MMGQELIPVFLGRPPVVKHEGQWVYVSVHDQGYLRMLRHFRDCLVMTHPDKTGSSELFLAIQRKLEDFREKEARWYWRLGLSTPDRLTMSPPKGSYQMKDRYPTGSPVRYRNRKRVKHETATVPA